MADAIRLMLDTNIASYIIKGGSLDNKIADVPIAAITVSSITEAELRYGLAKKPGATNLARLVQSFLNTVTVVPFDSAAALSYGELRANCENDGLPVGALDGLIAAHARSTASTLITRDQALLRLKRWLSVEKW